MERESFLIIAQPIYPVIQEIFNKTQADTGVYFSHDLQGTYGFDKCETYKFIMDWQAHPLKSVNIDFCELRLALDELAEWYFDEEENLEFGTFPNLDEFSDPVIIREVWEKYIQDVKDPAFKHRLGNDIAAKELTEAAYEYCKVSALAEPGSYLLIKSLEERMAKAFVINQVAVAMRFIDLREIYNQVEDLVDNAAGSAFESNADFEHFLRTLEDDPNFCPNEQMGYMMLVSRIFGGHYSDLWDNLCEYKAVFRDKILKSLDTLSAGEKAILIKRYGLSGNRRMSYEEIGREKEYRLSGNSIRLVAESAIRKLSEPEVRDKIAVYVA